MNVKKKKFFFFFFFLGGGGGSGLGGGVGLGGRGGQGRCEQRSEVFVKIKKKKKNWGGGVRLGGGQVGGVRLVGDGVRLDVNAMLGGRG